MSADLLGMGNASGQPVRWSMMVKMCLFPEVDVSHSVTRLIAILFNGLSGISVICKGYCSTFAFSHLQSAVCNIFSNVFIHSFPIILPFY